MKRTANAGALEWLQWAVFLAQRAQARHFVFGEVNLFAAKRGKRKIGDAKVAPLSE